MRASAGTNSGFVVLCHLLALPTHGYVNNPRPSLVPRSAAFVGPASCTRQPSVLFSSNTDVYTSADESVDTTGTPSSAPTALGTSGDWSAYLDESKGLIYYFNPSTGESKWEPPEGVDFSGVQMKIGASKKVEMRERLKTYLEGRLKNDPTSELMGAMQQDRRDMEWKRKDAGEKLRMKKSQLRSTSTTIIQKDDMAKKTGSSDRDIVSEWGEWQALVDSKRGQIYYFNKTTRSSSWAQPEGFPAFKLSASKRIALEEQNKRYLEWHKDAAKVNVLGRGSVVISDSNFDDGSPEPAAEVKANSANSNGVSQPTPKPEAKIELTTNNNVSEGKSVERESTGVKQPPTLPIVQQGDWSAYFDINSGLVYYYNEISGATTWDPPTKDFPRIGMDQTTTKVLDSGQGNISMERALGYIGMDEMAAALEWEEAKKKERARKAAKRAKEEPEVAESEVKAVDMYEAAKKAEVERLEKETKVAEEQKVRENAAAKLAEQEKLEQAKIAAEEAGTKEREAAAKLAEQEKLEQERIVAEEAASKERELSAMLAIQEQLEQERLEKESLESKRLEKEQLEAEEKRKTEANMKQPVLPKEDPTFTVETVETMVAPLKTSTLYEMLNCEPTASRTELKRAYISLAKQSHPDALLQYGMVNDDETERRFVEIANAWKILGDPLSRRRYDRELQAKGISSKAGNMFENWVMGAAKAMDEALANAESDLENGGGKTP